MTEKQRRAIIDAVPDNWLDPLLTGPEAVIGKQGPYTARDIENVLRAIRERVIAAVGEPR
jgi:hypothetical protein